jgi:hypothetical protein
MSRTYRRTKRSKRTPRPVAGNTCHADRDYVGLCQHCGQTTGKYKRSFTTRRHARNALRMLRDSEHMSVYPCPSGSGYWHYGHTHEARVRGEGARMLGVAQINAMARATFGDQGPATG